MPFSAFSRSRVLLSYCDDPTMPPLIVSPGLLKRRKIYFCPNDILISSVRPAMSIEIWLDNGHPQKNRNYDPYLKLRILKYFWNLKIINVSIFLKKPVFSKYNTQKRALLSASSSKILTRLKLNLFEKFIQRDYPGHGSPQSKLAAKI